MTNCPRTSCKNKAIIHRQFGVLPCQPHQNSDTKISQTRKGQFATISQSNRVQEQRDLGGGDLVQPYDKGKANVDFFKLYPDRIDDYGVRQELEHM